MIRKVLFVLFLFCLPLKSLAAETVTLKEFRQETVHTGFTRAIEERTVSSEVSGNCTAVLFDVGDVVGEDGVLARIDPTFVRLALADNRIAVSKARRQLELERKTVSRLANLIERQSTAQAIYDEALLRAETLDITLEQLANERARLEERLQRHTLRGPPGWTVVARFVDPGEHVREGEQVLSLGNFRRLLVPFLLTYDELELIRSADRLEAYLPDLNRHVPLRIHRVAPGFSEKTRKIAVDLLIDEELRVRRGGLRVRISIGGPARSDIFQVPLSAVIGRYDAHWLERPDGSRVPVILLGTTGDGSHAVVQQEALVPGESVLLVPSPAE